MLGRQPLPSVETMLREAADDITAFAALPVPHWKKIWSTNPIVIWRSFSGVLDVRHAGSRSLILQPGRGYLQSSRKQSLRRDDACCTSHLPGFVA